MSLYLGIFLVSLSGLMFEIGLTRIFSATIWYHFAFVAISVALLGWGLGGFVLHLVRHRVAFTRERAAMLAFLYGLSIPLALWLIVRVPFHPDRLSFYFGVSLLPFLLAGMVLSMLFAIERQNAGRLYFADLLGASLGALAVTFLLGWLGGENAILLVAVAPLVAAGALARRLRVLSALAVLLVFAALGVNLRTGFLNIHSAPTKGLYRHMAAAPGSRIALTGWNAYSRIDAVTGLDPGLVARLYIDSDAWTNVLPWDGRLESLGELRQWYRAIPFEMAPRPARALIIGPGGGSDVLVALAEGSEKVTAVEMNPLMLRFARHFGDRAGHLYDQPRVETILSEGRTFIRRSNRRFDVILLGFVDSWAAVASGGLSLSENHLYTVEAFQAYYDHLTPGGQIAILRWDADIPRLVSNAIAMLGVREASRRLAVLLESRVGDREDPPQMIFMLKKTPFTSEESARLASFSGVSPVIVPGGHVAEPYASLLAGRMSFAQYAEQADSRVDPVFDDRPFFFARMKPWGLPPSMQRGFRQILIPILALCVLLLWGGKPKREPIAPYSASILYFASLGIGFIAVELALLQHLTLLLGHPIFTLSILLFTLLASGGCGSALGRMRSLRSVCLAIAGLAGLYALVLPRVIPPLLRLPLGARIALALALVAPLGFLMGMPFPRALQRTGRGSFPAPPFYWGLNGIFSVVGSMATMGAAVVFGFTWAMLGGAAFYLAAAFASRTFAGPGDLEGA